MKDKNGSGEISDNSLTCRAMRKENGTTSSGTARGHVEWRGGRWWLRYGRRWYPLPGSLPREEFQTARLVATRFVEQFGRMDPEARKESCDDYFDRLCAARESSGIVRVQADRWIWRKWIGPHLGQRPIAEVTREDIESLRDALDVEVGKRQASGLGMGISGSTAMTIWSIVQIMVRAACSSRDPRLRVCVCNPCEGILRPLQTRPRAGTILYPTEVQALLGCEHVPLEWRQAYAVALYTYARANELAPLTWADFDFTARSIHVNKTVDAFTGRVKAPKASVGRTVPIDPALLPLVHAMHGACNSDEALVVAVLRGAHGRLAERLREHLALAGVARRQVLEGSSTDRPVDFHSLRATGIAWLLNSGVPPQFACRYAGHADFSFMNRFVRGADMLSGTPGSPIPPIPESLVQASGQKCPAGANRPDARGADGADGAGSADGALDAHDAQSAHDAHSALVQPVSRNARRPRAVRRRPSSRPRRGGR